LSSTWYLSGSGPSAWMSLETRINRDSGTEYLAVGQFLALVLSGLPPCICSPVNIVHLFTGLSLGVHVFSVEVKVADAFMVGATIALNTCASNPERCILDMSVVEL